jgi:hypothetical protein
MMITQQHEISQQQVIAALFPMEAGTQALLFGVLVERVTAWTWKIAAGRERLLLAAVDALMRHAGHAAALGLCPHPLWMCPYYFRKLAERDNPCVSGVCLSVTRPRCAGKP